MEQNLENELQQFTAIYQMVIEFFVNYSFQILGAIIILLIGMMVANKVSNLVLKLCDKKGLDVTLSRFLAATTKIIIIAMVAIIALGKLGISVTPFLAAVGALSLGAGLAVQGLLWGFAVVNPTLGKLPGALTNTARPQHLTAVIGDNNANVGTKSIRINHMLTCVNVFF